MFIDAIEATPLSVPLLEPFVIASGRMVSTRTALVTVVVIDERTGRTARGYGEAAALPPVTREDQPDVLAHIARARGGLIGRSVQGHASLQERLDDAFLGRPVARSAVECALLDGWARLADVPVHQLLGAGPRPTLTSRTDITIPIHKPAHMGTLARVWWEQGFRSFKVKVGIDLHDDEGALRAVHEAAPHATLRLDANGGCTPEAALHLLDVAKARGIVVECFEQPCPRDDLDGMAAVTAQSHVPVIADESVCSLEDLDRVVARRAAHGINLKLAKMGGLVAAARIGRAARRLGMSWMAGAMVETRLGLTAMAHVVAAVGDDALIDLDTAFLLASNPFTGGLHVSRDTLTLTNGPGLDVALLEP